MIGLTQHALPPLQCRIDGIEVSACGDLLAWELLRRANAPDELLLHLAQQPGQDQPAPRASIVVVGDGVPAFTGRIVGRRWHREADGSRRLLIRAWDRLGELADRQPVRLFEERDTRAIVGEVVQAVGCRVAGCTGPRWQRWYQIIHSDLDLLEALCEASGLWYQSDGEHCRLFDGGMSGTPVTIDPSQVIEAECGDEVIGRPDRLAVQGWSSRDGCALQQAAAGDRCDGGGERLLAGLCGDDGDQLRHLGQGLLRHRRARGRYLRATVAGSPDLMPGQSLQAVDWPEAPEHPLCLFTVHHRCDAVDGFRTTVDTRPPEWRPLQRGSLTTLGIVTAVDDPGHRGRVRVRLPSFNDLTTHWLPVISAGAAADKGLMALPDRDDRVVVLAPNHALAHALVLGGIQHADGALDGGGADGSRIERFHFRGPGGHHITLDREADRLVIGHPGGSELCMDPQGVSLIAAGDLALKAPGHSITIAAAAVDFKRG